MIEVIVRLESSTITYMSVAVAMAFGGMLYDLLRGKKFTSDTNVRKYFNTLGCAVQAIFLLVIGSTTNEVTARFALLGTSFSF